MLQTVFITESWRETQQLAEKIAKELVDDCTLALFGDLGSGKTTFVQGLAKGLGIAERIISPTFIIIREHKFKNKKFYHVDLYRIQNDKQIEEELKEMFNSRGRIIAIEWAEKVENLLPRKRIEIYFEYISDNERKVIIKKYG